MKCWKAISLSATIFSMLISGCTSFKSYFSNDDITWFSNSYYRGYKNHLNLSYGPSSGTLCESDNSMINMKKGGLKLSVSFSPSARLEF
jgi:hypothetical protein